MSRTFWAVWVGALLAIVLMLVLAGCSNNGSRADTERQQETVERVRSQRPIHDLQYSQTFDTVNKWLERWDSTSKVSYVYLLADNGQMIGYYVAQGRPVSTCTFLTQPWQRVGRGEGVGIASAPALDGVYYDDCGTNSVYFFTADTDAFIEIGGDFKYFVTDQPLALDIQELRVRIEHDDE